MMILQKKILLAHIKNKDKLIICDLACGTVWTSALLSKIAFISSTEGGVDIETVAKKNPEKIITTKIDLKKILKWIK